MSQEIQDELTEPLSRDGIKGSLLLLSARTVLPAAFGLLTGKANIMLHLAACSVKGIEVRRQ